MSLVFTDFGDELERNHSYWQERVEALASLFEKFLPDSFQGETADSINLYFNEVHGYILAGLYELMEISKRNFLMYKNDYYELIDSSLHAVISEYELEHIADTMKRYKLELEDYHYELKQILNSVSDIVRIKEPSAEDLYDDYEAVIKYVEKLRDDILDLEAKHKREDFVEFNEVKARLTSFMDEVSSKGRSFKENYQTKAVSGLDSFADYNTALMAAESYIESTQERYEKALAAEAIRIEKLKAEQRIVDGTVRVVASVAVVAGIIILSGGTLAPAAIPTVIFAYGELTEGANNIYLGLEGDGSSRAFNPIRNTIFLGNQLTYDIAAFGLDIGAIKFSKPTITNLNQVVKYGAKSTTSGSTSRIKDLTKKLLGKVDDVGDAGSKTKVWNPLDDPKVAKDIIADPNAVYGYRPKPGSSLDKFDIDWSDANEVAKARAARLEYIQAMEAKKAKLSVEIDKYLSEGKSMKEIADIKVQQRNADRIKSYEINGDYENLQKLYNRNLQEYGRKEGPTAQQLLERYGTYEDVIYSSVKVNKGMNVALNIEN